MTLPNPKFAPRRNDLSWLRRRRRAPVPKVAETPPPAAGTAPVGPAPARSSPPRRAVPAPAGPRIDYTHHDRAHEAPAPPAAHPPPPRPAPAPPREQPAPPREQPAPAASADTGLDLSAPPASRAPDPPPAPRTEPPTSSDSSLDLSAPAPTPSPSPSPPAPLTSTSLDLGGGPTEPPAPSAASSTSLDLDGPAQEPPSRTPRRAAPPPPAQDRHHVVRRTRSRATTLLDFAAPVVTLGRLQSGTGQLTLDAVVGDDVGDLRIGAAWALADGRTGIVELDADRRHGPEGRRPVVWAQKEGRFERIALDLRQSRSLRRLLVYGFSPSRQTLNWGGTVVVTTYGGDRIEAPIVSAPSPAVMALVSVYNVDGEFVLRAEMDPVSGSVRDTCRAFGFDRITWLDDRTPVT